MTIKCIYKKQIATLLKEPHYLLFIKASSYHHVLIVLLHACYTFNQLVISGVLLFVATDIP